MSETKGVIYILTNPSFPEYVKIGYADNIEKRLAELNRTECTPFAFRVYATYEVDARLTDMKLHNIIDKLNPNLRAIDDVGGKKRVREFYAISAADAYSLFEAMAEIHGTEKCLKRYGLTAKQMSEQRLAEAVQEEARERNAPFSFDAVGIAVGEEIVFCCKGNAFDGTAVRVSGNKTVEYEGKNYSLSALACNFLEKTQGIAGPRFFKYKGEWLNEIRHRLGV